MPRLRAPVLFRALVVAMAAALLAGAALAGSTASAGDDPFGPSPGTPASPTDPGAVAPDPSAAAPEISNGPPAVEWTYPPSRAVGRPFGGRLVRGVQLPAWGDDFLTWDPVLKQSPNRDWRRWGTDLLVRRVLEVLAAYRAAHPDAPPVLVGDLSRPHGGGFGARFGGLGHASHQNGTDVDVYYPRRDGVLRAAWKPSQVDRELAQALVDGFARAGAQYVFVGPRLGLRRISTKIVRPLVHHDDHLHFRLR